MNCPHCNEELMTKDYEHLSVFTCKNCEGIWLTPMQLQQILAQRDKQFSPTEIQNILKAAHAGLSDAEAASVLPCPVCSQSMHADNYDYSSGIILHVCPQGDGLWFDKDELEQVQIFMAHWDNEENTRQQELLGKLKQVNVDEDAEEAAHKATQKINEAKANKGKSIITLSMIELLDVVFDFFDKMKMDD